MFCIYTQIAQEYVGFHFSLCALRFILPPGIYTSVYVCIPLVMRIYTVGPLNTTFLWTFPRCYLSSGRYPAFYSYISLCTAVFSVIYKIPLVVKLFSVSHIIVFTYNLFILLLFLIVMLLNVYYCFRFIPAKLQPLFFQTHGTMTI